MDTYGTQSGFGTFGLRSQFIFGDVLGCSGKDPRDNCAAHDVGGGTDLNPCAIGGPPFNRWGTGIGGNNNTGGYATLAHFRRYGLVCRPISKSDAEFVEPHQATARRKYP